MFSVRSSEESEGKSADLGMSCAGNSGRLLLLMPPFLEVPLETAAAAAHETPTGRLGLEAGGDFRSGHCS